VADDRVRLRNPRAAVAVQPGHVGVHDRLRTRWAGLRALRARGARLPDRPGARSLRPPAASGRLHDGARPATRRCSCTRLERG
jgi:hypothetical protein